MAGGRAIDSGLLLALAAVAAITVTAAARAGLTVLALFWPFRRNQNIGGGCQNHRVAGLVQAIHDARVCGVKTVGLGTDGGRGAAVGAFATTLVATATALATAFTATFAAAFSTATWLAFAITADLLSSTLGGFILALSASFATHGRSHGSLIGQCQILLDGIARDALATLTAVTALAAVALATDFAVLIARLLVGSYFASDFSAAFTATLAHTIIDFNSMTATRILTLPNVTGIFGKLLIIKNNTGAAAADITVTAPNGQYISSPGTATLTVADRDGVNLISVGGGWNTF